MNAPRTPGMGGPSQDEPDPTGIRDLLSSLPDPGPMPPDLTNRIEAALRQEAAARTDDRSNVAPLVSRAAASSATGDSAERSGRSTARARWLRPVAGLGAAAAIGIAALGGYQVLSNDAPQTQQAVPAPSTSTAPGGTGLADRISIQNSGKDYTSQGLATQAASLTHSTSGERSARAADGPLGTTSGLVTCLSSMGSEILGNGLPDKISADLGTYDGKSAVIVVVTENGKSKAWVLSRSCTPGRAKIAGPTAVA